MREQLQIRQKTTLRKRKINKGERKRNRIEGDKLGRNMSGKDKRRENRKKS